MEHQKFIKIKMRDKTSLTLPFEQVEQLLNSSEQFIMLYDEENKWTGQSLNKADIVSTDRDFDEERDWKRDNGLKLDSGTETPVEKEERIKHTSELFKKYRPKFLDNNLVE